MIKKKLNENEILLVLVCDNKAQLEQQLALLRNKNLLTPQGCTFSVYPITGKKNLAASFNEMQKKNSAKYKIYLTAPLLDIDQSFVCAIIDSFFFEPKTAFVGLMGSEIPIDGNYLQAKNFYGLYTYKDETGEIQNYVGKDPLYCQTVHMVESSFFATNEDFIWDEKMGEDFLVAAQCLNFRSKGYKVGVFYQDSPLAVFDKDTFSYSPKVDQQNYIKQLEKFQLFYRKKFQPLVSVLIPTYNQPKFCQEALESALNQTYKNIEILVGDDSTNEDTKKMIQPYLKKYSNIKYFYHDGKIPRGGGANMLFILNHCSGEYVNFLLHDDLFHPEKISKMMNYFVTDLEKEISLVTSARNRIDENRRFIRRQNPWQPHSDAIIKGEDVGRRLLFILANFVGELTTVLFKKKDVTLQNINTGEHSFAIGNFCGISSRAYGDMDTWLNILKSGGALVFMSETLSYFRQHAAQNTFNPNTRITLPLDALNFVTIAWLNDVFFHNVEDFHYCLDKWPILADRWIKPIAEDDPDIIKKRKEWLFRLKEIFGTHDYAKMTDVAISYLLESYGNSPQITSLVRKNLGTNLLEKKSSIPYEVKNIDLCRNIWTVHGSPTISDKNAKFSKALQFSDFTSYLICSKGIELGGQDFTLEYWAYFDRSNATFSPPIALLSSLDHCLSPYMIFNQGNGDFIRVVGHWNGVHHFKDGDFGGTSPIIGKLSHFELDYKHDGGIWKIFVNGMLESEKAEIILPKTFFQFICVGKLNELVVFTGSISELRISSGICRHTENFEPPNEPAKADKHTLCLLNFDN
ncbi:MAG: glycosyltransferase [Selenomonadaceae bacterium]|nr:glycosyltransferase [Selenomonadaceae bacterium]